MKINADKMKEMIEAGRTDFDRLNLADREIVIWGTGVIGRTFYRQLQDELKPVCFGDNDSQKWGKTIEGLTVRSATEILSLKKPLVIIAASCQFAKEIAKQLGDMKIDYITAMQYVVTAHYDTFSRVEKYLIDEWSREVYLAAVVSGLSADVAWISAYYTPDQCFAIPEFFRRSQRQVFVDCGAYVGDTVERYIMKTIGAFSQIYAFEPGMKQFRAMEVRISRLRQEWALEEERITLENAAVGKRNAVLHFQSGGIASSNCIVNGAGEDAKEVRTVSLDSYFKDIELTENLFIKADIEGYELDLLKGAEKIIKTYRPRLAICIYHSPADLYLIPEYIHTLVPEYKMSIRHHSGDDIETVLYCWV